MLGFDCNRGLPAAQTPWACWQEYALTRTQSLDTSLLVQIISEVLLNRNLERLCTSAP